MTSKSDLPYVVFLTKDAKPTVYRDSSEHGVDLDTVADGFMFYGNSLRQRIKAAVSLLMFGSHEARVVHSNELSTEMAQELNDELIDKLYHPDGVFTGEMFSDAWVEEEAGDAAKY